MEAERTRPRPSGSANGTGTLGKAIDVLELVAETDEPIRFTEILRRCDQPRGTLHRQLSNLVEEGLLVVNRDHSYSLGVRLLKFASKAWANNEFRVIAEPHLRRLHELTGETVHMGVLRGLEVIYLDKVESRQAVRMYSQIGNASPVFCTGVGKAALSCLSKETVEEMLPRIAFRRFTEHTLVDPATFAKAIDRARSEGVAYDREEHEIGIRCVAAPIHTADRSFVAGISVTAPAYRAGEETIAGWVDLVREAAAAIMDDMRNRLGPRV
ncbi:IclR family transcriptional regulator [Pararhizobium mangrovi]|uniref:IclR family transcriptional regulator n=1 Tax=Pararhizobium mangrovi TaxID=2590452 RepID=A0A506TZ95_9HYPH|nr:IclR family transcriptional regulator [Pararhizobium mangrovi]TPW27413.1 IclR family transcriptional regulator [Pararhizobium mangrovi]